MPQQMFPNKIEVTPLQNGIRVITQKDKRTSSVNFAVGINVGSMNELDGSYPRGTAHFLEHMGFCGSYKSRHSKGEYRPGEAQHSVSCLEGHRGFLDAGTYLNSTIYTGNTSTKGFSKGVALLSSIVCHPKIDEVEIKREQNPIYLEWVQERQNTKLWQRQLETEIAYGNHPSVRSVLGTPQSIKAIQKQDLLAFHEKYRSGNTVVAVKGDVEHNNVVELVENQFDLSRRGSSSTPYLPAYIGGVAKVAKDFPETLVTLGFHCKDQESSSHMKIGYDVVASILGNGFDGLLNQTLRESRGLIRSVECDNDCNDNLLTISFTTSAKDVGACLNIIREDLYQLTSRADQDFLDNAKFFMDPTIYRSTENILGLAGNMLKYGKVLHADDYLKSVTQESISAAIDNMLQHPPTLVYSGKIKRAPSFNKVKEIFL